jgi:squalene-hopene/tetraprenyl-beta-curcumene cyclase
MTAVVPAMADEPDVGSAADAAAYQRVVDRAVQYLRTKGQSPDGSFAGHVSPAVTAVVATGIMRHGRTPDDPLVAKSLKYLEGFVQPDGGIYRQGAFYRNYETCLAIQCLSEANHDGQYDKQIRNARQFLKALQWDDDEGHDRGSLSYGGAGYGKHKRPDLSNTSFLIDALRASGSGPDDPAIQEALVFVSRCQNLESQYNSTKFPAKNPDGGFYYTCAAGGSSQAGETSNGGLRSYGSMTYAGLKSMLYAGLGPNDPRVEAALKWIRDHYELDANPGMGDAGLYYYYHTFAKALDATGLSVVTDTSGNEHDWRRDLRAALIDRQRDDGSWMNENPRWMEAEPTLVTGYVLLALDYCRPTDKEEK